MVVLSMIDLVLVKRDMHDVKAARRMELVISDQSVVLCKMNLAGR